MNDTQQNQRNLPSSANQTIAMRINHIYDENSWNSGDKHRSTLLEMGSSSSDSSLLVEWDEFLSQSESTQSNTLTESSLFSTMPIPSHELPIQLLQDESAIDTTSSRSEENINHKSDWSRDQAFHLNSLELNTSLLKEDTSQKEDSNNNWFGMPFNTTMQTQVPIRMRDGKFKVTSNPADPECSKKEDNGAELKVVCSFPACGKWFESCRLLRKHEKSHGPRSHVCADCGKAFSETAKLKRHRLVHTRVKAFECPFEGCGKRFSLDFNLRTHILLHSGFRPFKCTVDGCDKRFSQKVNRDSHLSTHDKRKSKY